MASTQAEIQRLIRESRQRGPTGVGLPSLGAPQVPEERQLFTRFFGVPTPFLQLGTFMGLEGFAALGVDIITDPLTWLSFGIGGLSKLGRAAKFGTEFSQATKAGRALTSTEIATEIIKSDKIARTLAKNSQVGDDILLAVASGDIGALKEATKVLNKASKLTGKDKTAMRELANFLHFENKSGGVVPLLGQSLEAQAQLGQRGLLKIQLPFPSNLIGGEFFQKTLLTGEPIFRAVDKIRGVRNAGTINTVIRAGEAAGGASAKTIRVTEAVARGLAFAPKPDDFSDIGLLRKEFSPNRILRESEITAPVWDAAQRTEARRLELLDEFQAEIKEAFTKPGTKKVLDLADRQDVARVMDGQIAIETVSKDAQRAAEKMIDLRERAGDLLNLEDSKRLENHFHHIFNVDEGLQSGDSFTLLGEEMNVFFNETGASQGMRDMVYTSNSLQDAARRIGEVAPREQFAGFLKERVSKRTDFNLDSLEVMNIYAAGVARKVAMDMKGGFLKTVRPVLENEGFRQAFPNRYQYVEDYANAFRGLPGAQEKLLDAGFENIGLVKAAEKIRKIFPGKRGQAVADNLISSRRMARTLGGIQFTSKIAGSLGTAGINLTQLPINTYAKIGLRGTATGIKEFFTKKGRELVDAETRIFKDTTKFDADQAKYSGILGKALEFLALPFAKSEQFVRGATYLGARSEAKLAGKSLDEAKRFGREVVEETQFIYDSVDRVPIFRSPIGRLIGQFNTFTVKQLEFIGGLRGQEKDRFLGALAVLGGPAAFGINFLLREQDPNSEVAKGAELIQGLSLAGLAGIDVSGKLGVGFLPQVTELSDSSFLDLLGPSVRGARSIIGAIQEEVTGVPTYPGKREALRELPAGAQLVRFLDVLGAAQEDGVVRDEFGRVKFRLTPKEQVAIFLGQTPVRVAEIRRQMNRRRKASRQHSDLKRALIQQIVDGTARNDREEIQEAFDEAQRNGITITDRDIQRFLQTAEQTQEERQFRGTPREIKREVPLVGR